MKNTKGKRSTVEKKEKRIWEKLPTEKRRLITLIREGAASGEIEADVAEKAENDVILLAQAPNAHKGIPIELMINLRKRGLSYGAVARVIGCSKRTVQDRLQKLNLDISMTTEYQRNRSDILAFHQRRILNSITDKNLEDADLKAKAVSFGVLFDKEKIDTGKLPGSGKLVIAIVNYSEHGQTTKVMDISQNIPAPVEEPAGQSQ